MRSHQKKALLMKPSDSASELPVLLRRRSKSAFTLYSAASTQLSTKDSPLRLRRSERWCPPLHCDKGSTILLQHGNESDSSRCAWSPILFKNWCVGRSSTFPERSSSSCAGNIA